VGVKRRGAFTAKRGRKEGRNKLVCFQKRLPAGEFILLLFFTMDVEQLIGAVYSRKALWQKKDVNHHNRDVIDNLWEEVAVALGSNSKYIKLYSLNLL
jgi:hypothetical protein